MSAVSRPTRTIDFAAIPKATGTGKEFLGTDSLTLETQLQAVGPNMITRIRLSRQPAAGDQGFLLFKRAGVEIRRYPLSYFRDDLTAPPFPGMPIGLRPGLFQLALVFPAIAADIPAQQIYIELQQSLNPVTV